MTELNEITASRDKARDEHEDLRKKRLSEFMAGFLVITNKLKEMYQVFLMWRFLTDICHSSMFCNWKMIISYVWRTFK